MSASEALAARSFNTLLGSASRAAGSPGSPAHAFAQEWLGAVMQENLPTPAPTATVPAADPDGVQTFPVPAPGPVVVTPLPPSPPVAVLPDPFLLPPSEEDWTVADDIAARFGVPREDVVNAGWRDDASRSLEVLHGFAEGAGFSILEMGRRPQGSQACSKGCAAHSEDRGAEASEDERHGFAGTGPGDRRRRCEAARSHAGLRHRGGPFLLPRHA